MIATLLAVERFLRGDRTRLVSMQAPELSGIVMDFVHLPRGASPFRWPARPSARWNWARLPAPMAAILFQRDVRDKVSVSSGSRREAGCERRDFTTKRLDARLVWALPRA